MLQTTFEKAEANSDAIEALGHTVVHLLSDELATLPWQLVTGCEDGATRRNSIPTSVNFYAQSETNGLRYEWHINLERWGVATEFNPDMETCRAVMNHLSGDARLQFRRILSNIALGLREDAHRIEQRISAQRTTAGAIADLAAGH